MKRDMDLVREILNWAEDQEHGFVEDNPKIEGYSEEEIGYHIYIMNEAGLVLAEEITSMADKSPRAVLLRLTWGGYEFRKIIQFGIKQKIRFSNQLPVLPLIFLWSG